MQDEYLGIKIDYDRDSLFSESGLSRLKQGYMTDAETSPQQRFAFVANEFASNKEHAQRMYDYISQMFVSCSTPVLSYGKTKKSLPISCYSTFLDDSLESILDVSTETRMMAVCGGGVGVHVNLRPQDQKSSGIIPHLQTYDADTLAFKQGTCYHPDTEILTEIGFKSFKYAMDNNLRVFQVDIDGNCTLTKPINWIEHNYDGHLINFKDNKNINLRVTPNHRMYFKYRRRVDNKRIKGKYVNNKRVIDDNFTISESNCMPIHRDVFLNNSIKLCSNAREITPSERFLIAFQADGYFYETKDKKECHFRFKKSRKIERLRNILELCKYEFDIIEKNDATVFKVKCDAISKTLNWVNFENIDCNYAREFLQEVSHWDGTQLKFDKKNRFSFSYCSTIKENCDILQSLAALCGVKSRLKCEVGNFPKQDLYKITFSEGELFGCENMIKSEEYYSGKVYCAEVPNGGLIVRSGGHTLVCGNSRRGATAAYIDIDHPEIIEFLEMRKPTGGDPNRKCLNLHHGINVTDDFMHRIYELSTNEYLTNEEKQYLDAFPLINKHTNEIIEYISAKELWARILEVRMQTGEPYLFFIDTANAALPEYQKKMGLRVNGSNLCLTGDTLIQIKTNLNLDAINIRLDDFVSKFKEEYKNRRVYVKSFDGVKIVWSEVIDADFTGEFDELYEIETHEYSIRCTENHKIFTKNRGYVEASELQQDDILLQNMLEDCLVTESTLTIDKIQTNKTKVYDLSVKDTECFFANNILVHNCAEISIPTNTERSLVCCLLSINLEHWDKIEPIIEQFMLDVVEFLDNVLEVFIQKTENIPELQKARYSAIRGRDIGIGALGWHSLLQSRSIPFESAMAIGLNKKIWKLIKDNALKATELLANIRGACPDALADNVNHRNSKLLALAPNAASSFILNTSPSCEPYKANVFLEKGINGTITHKNKHLVKLLDEKGLNRQEIWSSIIANDGSIQHLIELTEIEKDVFKTAFEIDQTWIINQAADRQEHICQSQSTNIFFSPTERIEVIHWVHLLAWKNKMKSLYYCRSDSLRKSDKVGEKVVREKIEGLSELVKQDEVCLACQ